MLKKWTIYPSVSPRISPRLMPSMTTDPAKPPKIYWKSNAEEKTSAKTWGSQVMLVMVVQSAIAM